MGLDLGLSKVAIVTEGEVRTAPFCPGLERKEKARRRHLRTLDRQRRANNPHNFNPDGTVRPRSQRQPWKASRSQGQTRATLANILRALAAQRKSLQGALTHQVLELGNRIRVERCNKRAWAKQYGRSIGHKAPGMFQSRLAMLAEGTGGSEEQIRPGPPAFLRAAFVAFDRGRRAASANTSAVAGTSPRGCSSTATSLGLPGLALPGRTTGRGGFQDILAGLGGGHPPACVVQRVREPRKWRNQYYTAPKRRMWGQVSRSGQSEPSAGAVCSGGAKAGIRPSACRLESAPQRLFVPSIGGAFAPLGLPAL